MVLQYIFFFIFLLVILFLLWIKIKYRFWSIQPVFHFYDFYYWVYNVGIIRPELPEKNRYTNFKNIKTLEIQSITNKYLQEILVLIQLNYLRNGSNKFMPKKENFVPYFKGHFDKTFFSIYLKDIPIIHNKTNETFTEKQIIGVMTSRPLHVSIKSSSKKYNNFDVYYVDYLCVNRNYRKQGIAPELIQTHEYNQSHLNKKICVSLFKREEELTGIIPLTIYKTYCFKLKHNISTYSNLKYTLLTGDNQNLYYFYNFLKQQDIFDIIIYPELSNIIELVQTNNIFIKMLMDKHNILAVYVFRNTCLQIEDKNVLSCVNSIRGQNCEKDDFINGFRKCINEFSNNYGYVTIENISHNNLLVHSLNLNPIIVSPMAYFFYNFAYSPFSSEKCFILT